MTRGRRAGRIRERAVGARPVGAALAGAVAVAVLAACGAGSDGGSDGGSDAATTTPAPSASLSGSASTTTPTTGAPTTGATAPGTSTSATAPATGGGGVDATVPLTPGSTLPPVPIGSPAAAGGVTVTVSRVESVQGEAAGPGQVAGPAVRLTIVVRAASAAPLPLDAVTVDLRDAGGASAPQLSGPGAQPFGGTVPAGGTATGVYVFGLATDARSGVSVSLTYAGAAPTVVFRGDV